MAYDPHVQDRVIPALVEAGKLDNEDVERAERLARTDKSDLGTAYQLVKLGILSSIELSKELAKHFKVKTTDLTKIEIKEDLMQLLSKESITEQKLIPIHKTDDTLYIAMADPTDIQTLEDLRFGTGLQVIPVVADLFSLNAFINQRYTQLTNIDEIMEELSAEDSAGELEVIEEDTASAAIREEIDSAPVVKFINQILQDAVKRGASDIHFEFFENESRVRFRIDGALVNVVDTPKKWDRFIQARLKILAKLDVSERRLPQDGRTRLKFEDRQIDFRVSSLPVNFGEKIVLRILDKSVVSLDLHSLGIEGREYDQIMETIQSPYGMILVTGPTGSGKTTTLYSVLSQLNKPSSNILTIEDPIEYNLHGINQVQVKPEIQFTFAKALKSFLRQDPNIIMVGEIRDPETASIATRAALTGHLVLSTLHTNDAASAIVRLSEMGMEQFNIASALSLLVAQRLVRKICPNCKQEVEYSDEKIRYAHLTTEEASRITFRRGAGCDYCNKTGYKGRLGLYEVLRKSPEVEQMILEGRTSSEIKQQAIREGMKTLRAAGLKKVEEGLTTLEEVMKETTL